MSSSMLSPDLRAVELKDAEIGKTYYLAFSKLRSDYESWIAHLQGPDDNTQLLMRILNGAGTLIDLGANIGAVAVPVAKRGSRVIAVEMNPANCLKLWSAIALNELHCMSVIQCAVSDNDGILRYSGDEAWGHVDPQGLASALCLRLDTIVSCLGTPSGPLAIKIDIEGHESLALRGALRTIARYRPTILFESIEIEGTPGNAKASKKILEGAGYALFLMRGKILIPRTSNDPQEGHVADFLAVPSEQKHVLSNIDVEVRSLTDDERIAWISEMTVAPVIHHQRHAAKMILRWCRDEPDLCSKCLKLVPSLLDLTHLADLHEELRQLV